MSVLHIVKHWYFPFMQSMFFMFDRIDKVIYLFCKKCFNEKYENIECN